MYWNMYKTLTRIQQAIPPFGLVAASGLGCGISSIAGTKTLKINNLTKSHVKLEFGGDEKGSCQSYNPAGVVFRVLFSNLTAVAR